MQTSDIIVNESRAYLKVCIASDQVDEALDFGTAILAADEQEWIDFFVHKTIDDDPQVGRCIVFEFWGIPKLDSKTFKFTMEWVGYLAPDEGKACQVYQQRANLDSRLSDAGIEIACIEKSGVPQLEIVKNLQNLNQNIAQELIDQVISGVIPGPWIFNLQKK